MQHVGVRTVRLQTVCDHQNLQITFQVLNVERPLISVGKLAKDGCEINFDGTGGFIHHKGRSLRFERVGDMFGIRVRVLGNSGGSNFVSGGRNLVMPTFEMSRVDYLRQEVPVSIMREKFLVECLCQASVKKCPHWRVVRQSLHRVVDP